MEEVLKTVNTNIIIAHTNYLYFAKELLSRVAHTNSSTGQVRVAHTSTSTGRVHGKNLVSESISAHTIL
jgi:hypothetical protein